MRLGRFSWVPVVALTLAACTNAQSGDSGTLSEDQENYIEQIGELQARVDDAFASVDETLSGNYNTREVLFAAVRDVGYEGVAQTVLGVAETIEPPDRYAEDHERWLAHRRLAVELAPEVSMAIDNQDIREMNGVFTALFNDWADMVRQVEPEVCRALNQDQSLCPAPEGLPGGDYGVEVYEILRELTLETSPLFNFFGDMSTEERSLRLEEVQPQIENSLSATAEALRAMNPPDAYVEDHEALVEFFDKQHATAVSITEANSSGDVARVLQLFDQSNIHVQQMWSSLSPEFREIAAPGAPE